MHAASGRARRKAITFETPIPGDKVASERQIR